PFELRLQAGQNFSFLFRNTEPFERAFDILWYFVPASLRRGSRGEIITNLVEVDRFKILGRPMRGKRLLEKCFQATKTKFADPIGVFFDVGNVMNGFLA